jgi:hypothetical protein
MQYRLKKAVTPASTASAAEDERAATNDVETNKTNEKIRGADIALS